MIKITVNASRTYDVIMEHGALAKAGQYICDVLDTSNTPDAPAKASAGKKICIITDANVDELYGQPEHSLWQSLTEAGFEVHKYVFPGGESHKNMSTITDILEYLASNSFTRSDILLALGGGITGDVTGFAAATFLRGIEFIQVPTSLLAVVDSSVGGKTGVNLSSGKNLAGAFWQPSLVLFDPDVLKTLTGELILDGIAETIKSGIIADPDIISMSTASICRTGTDLISPANAANCNLNIPASCDTDFLAKLAAMAVEVKRRVVEEDERENGSRQLLNLGHTVAHAIEKCSNYRISHGHAVAMGMAIISAASADMGWSDNDTYETILTVLNTFNFPLQCPYTAKELASAALHDKKRRGETITLVIPQKIGKCVLKPVDVTELEDIFARGLDMHSQK